MAISKETLVKQAGRSRLKVEKRYRLRANIETRIKKLEFQYKRYLKTINDGKKWQIREKKDRIRVWEVHRKVLYKYLYILDINSSKKTKNTQPYTYNIISVENKINDVVYRLIRIRYKIFPNTLKLHSEKLFGMYLPYKDNTERELYTLTNRINNYENRKSDKFKNLCKRHKKVKFKNTHRTILRKQMRDKAVGARKSEFIARLMYEAGIRARQGWYFIFNTLTVTQEEMTNVFKENAIEWKNYIKQIDKDVSKKVYGSCKRSAKKLRKVHVYAACIEKGKETGRLHIHVLHMIHNKGLPDSCYDANKGKTVAIDQTIHGFKKYWKNGHSKPLAVRYSINDAFAKKNWRWPYEKHEQGHYVPKRAKGIGAIVNYMAKYMDKETRNLKGDQNKWKMRISRNLGMIPIKMLVRTMNLKTLEEMIVLKSQESWKIMDKKIPEEILQREVIREYLSRTQISSLWNTMAELEPQENILKQKEDMKKKILDYKMQNSGDSSIQIIKSMDAYKITRKIQRLEKRLYGVRQSINYLTGSDYEVNQ